MKPEHGGDWAGFLREYGMEPLDFSANISPLGLPEGVRAAAAEAVGRADRYPDPLCRGLRRELSVFHGVPEDGIVCGAGAADLIYRLGAALRPKRVLIPAPAFSEYARALDRPDCRIERYLLSGKKDFRLDEGILDRLEPALELLILCEPSNPAGVVSDPALLERILRRCRRNGTLLAVDECFLPFLGESRGRGMIPLLGGGRLLIFRAFTKFYAMAGLRLGYLLTDEKELAEKVAGCGQPWPVSTVAQEAGIAALREKDYAASLRKLIREQRPVLLGGLRRLGLRVIPGEANYLLFYTSVPELGGRLARKGILIRDCAGYPGLTRGWYRIAVRTAPENERLLKAMAQVMGTAGGIREGAEAARKNGESRQNTEEARR